MHVEEIATLDKGRIKILFDNGDAFVLYKKEAGKKALTLGSEITEEEYEAIRNEIILPRAKKRAMHLLEKMDRTEYELKEKLRQSYYPVDIINKALEYVKSYHYVDDSQYACNYIKYRGQQKSSRLVALELTKRGVSKELIERALQQEYTLDGEAVLIQKWMEKKHFDTQSADMKEKQRMYQFLIRKGFRAEDISRLMRE